MALSRHPEDLLRRLSRRDEHVDVDRKQRAVLEGLLEEPPELVLAVVWQPVGTCAQDGRLGQQRVVDREQRQAGLEILGDGGGIAQRRPRGIREVDRTEHRRASSHVSLRDA